MQRNIIRIFIANLFQLAYGIVQTIILSRFIIDKAEFGRLQQILLVSAILISTFSALPNSLNFFFGYYNLDKDSSGSLIKRFFNTTILLSLFISIFFIFFKSLFFKAFDNNIFLQFSGMIFLLFFVRQANTVFQNICLLKQKLNYLMALNIFQLIVLPICFLLLNHFSRITIQSVFYILICNELIKFLTLLIVANQGYFNAITKSTSYKLLTKVETKYVFTLILNAILITLINQVDRLIVAVNTSASTYSDYSLGSFANPFVSIVTSSIMVAFVPIISSFYANKETRKIVDLWRNTSEKGSVFIIPFVLFTIFFGSEIIDFLFGARYTEAGLLFQIFNAKYLIAFVVFGPTMNAIGLEKMSLLNSLISVVITTALVFIGLKINGAIGAMIGCVIASYLGMIFPVVVINRSIKVSFLEYFPLKTFTGIILLSILGCVSFLVLRMVFNVRAVFVLTIFFPIYYISMLLVINQYIVKLFEVAELKGKLSKLFQKI